MKFRVKNLQNTEKIVLFCQNSEKKYTWSGIGEIKINNTFENPLTKVPYNTYEISLKKEIVYRGYKTDTLWNINDYGEYLTGRRMNGAEGWTFVEIEIDGEWHSGNEVCRELFNIKVTSNSGTWIETYGPGAS